MIKLVVRALVCQIRREKGEAPHRKHRPAAKLMEQGRIPHEQLVQTFRNLIKEQQDTHTALNSFGAYPNEQEALPPERAVRSVLEWYAGSAIRRWASICSQFSLSLGCASYDRYEPGIREEGLAGSVCRRMPAQKGSLKSNLLILWKCESLTR